MILEKIYLQKPIKIKRTKMTDSTVETHKHTLSNAGPSNSHEDKKGRKQLYLQSAKRFFFTEKDNQFWRVFMEVAYEFRSEVSNL